MQYRCQLFMCIFSAHFMNDKRGRDRMGMSISSSQDCHTPKTQYQNLLLSLTHLDTTLQTFKHVNVITYWTLFTSTGNHVEQQPLFGMALNGGLRANISSQDKSLFFPIALYTVQIVSKELHSNKQEDSRINYGSLLWRQLRFCCGAAPKDNSVTI